ncbi:two-component system regulatory protein YycI [Gracilibacillus sp. S3-1-1]|uniref:Two-component system regulatory protein YycI n=1 Tax=Gracilibacillus pellucidus TaxID=3095368 RepID=A0ACC6M396_9BACI|nr:two-component system regulatory protein YycI [Gracilibacillus sp. S3-1-1]MDX8045412.1 two-component system regulatory protein YycI [Gracilibacillus sp. S3-1-1]
MQWGQIKTLFILCFLILDIFLLHHYISNPSAVYEYTEEFPREDDVRNNISGLDYLPDNAPTEEAILYAATKEFDEEDREEIDALPDQKKVIIDNQLIFAEFDKPLNINIAESPQELASYVWDFDQYQYFGMDEVTDSYIFFQQMDHPVYFNKSGLLLVHTNEEGEVTGYVQTILEKTEDSSSPEEINTPFEALAGLYFNDGYITSGDEITKEVALGYHNLLPLPNGVQVLAPTWQFEVNSERYYFVNAIESHLSYRNTKEFIDEVKYDLLSDFNKDSNATIEVSGEDWDEEEIEQYLVEILGEEEIETNGVE